MKNEKFFSGKAPVKAPVSTETPKSPYFGIQGFNFSIPETPVLKEVQGKEWVLYGEDNLYPQHLKTLVSKSPTQSAIIESKSGMIAGSGWKFGEVKLRDVKDNNIRSFFDNIYGTHEIHTITGLIAYDYSLYGAFALEIVYNLDLTAIAAVKYVDVSLVRSGKYNEAGKVSTYYTCRDWAKANKPGFPVEKIQAYNPEEKQNYNQLLYVKRGSLEYYGTPGWISGLSYVEIEGQVGDFHKANLSNAFAPSIAIKFYERPGSDEEEMDAVARIEKTYKGTGNAGRAMIFFSDGKENAPDVTPVAASDLHQQYIAINDIAKEMIMTANQVTSPALFGVKTSGQLGGSQELATAYTLYNNSVVEPDRLVIESNVNMLLEENGVLLEAEIIPFNPLTSGNTSSTAEALSAMNPLLATKILELMSADEIRAMVGLAPAAVPRAETAPATPAVEQTQRKIRI